MYSVHYVYTCVHIIDRPYINAHHDSSPFSPTPVLNLMTDTDYLDEKHSHAVLLMFTFWRNETGFN